jgi:nitrogen-specific signal transduction histidine kinase
MCGKNYQMHAHLRDREHDGRNGGTGMGLAIVQAVMTSHGGARSACRVKRAQHSCCGFWPVEQSLSTRSMMIAGGVE